jgi:DNA-binding CsgD family transcriptional regulator
MTADKRIIIGCDNAVNLTAVLDSMRETTLFRHHIITVTRAADITGLLRSFGPDLLLLCFRNNQTVIDNLNVAHQKDQVPVLCLTGKWENETLNWNKNNIVFTCPLEHIQHPAYLHYRINSIFVLVAHTYKKAAAQRGDVDGANGSSNGKNGRHLMELEQKTTMLLKIKERLILLCSRVQGEARAEITSLLNFIKMYAGSYDLWGDFQIMFDETDPAFLPLLTKRFPLLTAIDLKYCCYLKMNMSNDDLKNVFGISLESVRTHKHRLKKKMSLSKDEDLRNFLLSVA